MRRELFPSERKGKLLSSRMSKKEHHFFFSSSGRSVLENLSTTTCKLISLVSTENGIQLLVKMKEILIISIVARIIVN